MSSANTGSNIVTAFKVAWGYTLFLLLAALMTVLGLLLMPIGLIAYLVTLPMRGRRSAAAN